MTIDFIRQRLQTHRPIELHGDDCYLAAVAIVLRDTHQGPEFIAIHRSDREDDPWSGHMALPGGRQAPSDRDLFVTAARETREEVGIDLEQHGELLGHLDDLPALGRGRLFSLAVRPFVCALTAPVVLTPNTREVQSAFWVPLRFLREPAAQGIYRHLFDGHELEHQAFVYEGRTIWGLTYRILAGFLEVLR